SNASDDFPDPDRPVITTSRLRGTSRTMFFRLWVRAPRTRIDSMRAKANRLIYPVANAHLMLPQSPDSRVGADPATGLRASHAARDPRPPKGGRRGRSRASGATRDPMTPHELRSSVSLASIFALRMLGLFLILPVFAVHARGMPGGDDATLIGLALGIYGLTQGVLQIPFGIASDRFGRKRVIVFGLLLFAAGSFVAAGADDLLTTIVGRAVQGAGASSAAVPACIAASARDSQRTKAMAMVGGSIGLTFALSLVGAPLLYDTVGMGGIFALTGLL